MTEDYVRYYDLEEYLFNEVRQKFHQDGKLDAFDLFSIIIWKAERSKSKLAKRLIRQAGNLETAALQFSIALFQATTPKDRLVITMDSWGFYLPMASAILAVLWPDDFTVFDVRVCEELGDFENLNNLTTKSLWPRYLEYCDSVKRAVPQYCSLRRKG